MEFEIEKGKLAFKKEEKEKLQSKGIITKTGEIDIYEALRLVDKKKAKIKNEDLNSAIKKLKINTSEFKVFNDLKDRGYNVGSGLKYGFAFRVYDKGVKPGEDHSLWLVEVLEWKKDLKIKDLLGRGRLAHSARKKMLLAIIDYEGDINYLELGRKRL